MPVQPTSALSNFMQPTAMSGIQSDWKPTDSYDAARHHGVIGMAALMPEYERQLNDVGAATDQRRLARANVNKFSTAAGRQEKVQSFGNDAFRRGQQMGQKIRERMMASGGGDIGASAALLGGNSAAKATNEYSSYLESPEGQMEMARALLEVNSEEEVVSLMKLFSQMESQAAPRDQFHEQMAAQDAANDGIGGWIGPLMDMVGQSGGWGSLLGLGGKKKGGTGGMSLLLGNDV